MIHREEQRLCLYFPGVDLGTNMVLPCKLRLELFMALHIWTRLVIERLGQENVFYPDGPKSR